MGLHDGADVRRVSTRVVTRIGKAGAALNPDQTAQQKTADSDDETGPIGQDSRPPTRVAVRVVRRRSTSCTPNHY
jgi:hypothetical protein